jgi:integrase
VRSPLPDYLYESETEKLYQVASIDPRTYLLVLLLLETGLKSSELYRLTRADVDTSDPYRPELWIKHTGKGTKKDRKVALPERFLGVYTAYLDKYKVTDVLFDFTDRFGQTLANEIYRAGREADSVAGSRQQVSTVPRWT